MESPLADPGVGGEPEAREGAAAPPAPPPPTSAAPPALTPPSPKLLRHRLTQLVRPLVPLALLDRLLVALLLVLSQAASAGPRRLSAAQRVRRALLRSLLPFTALVGGLIGAMQIELFEPTRALLGDSLSSLLLPPLSPEEPVQCVTAQVVPAGWELACVGVHATLRRRSDRLLTHVAHLAPSAFGEQLRRMQRNAAWHAMRVSVLRAGVEGVDSADGRRAALLREAELLPADELLLSSDGLATFWVGGPSAAVVAFRRLTGEMAELGDTTKDSSGADTTVLVRNEVKAEPKGTLLSTAAAPAPVDIRAEIVCAADAHGSGMPSSNASAFAPGKASARLLMGRAGAVVRLLRGVPQDDAEGDEAYFVRLCSSSGQSDVSGRGMAGVKKGSQGVPDDVASPTSLQSPASSQPMQALASSDLEASALAPRAVVDFQGELFYVVPPPPFFGEAWALVYSPGQRAWILPATGRAPALVHVASSSAAQHVWELLQGRDNAHCGSLFCFPLYVFCTVLVFLVLGVALGLGWNRCLGRCAAGRRALKAEAMGVPIRAVPRLLMQGGLSSGGSGSGGSGGSGGSSSGLSSAEQLRQKQA